MAPSPLITIDSDMDGFSPIAVHDVHLAKREPYAVDPAAGSRPPQAYNNLGFQIGFAFIGLGMTLTALWFFFRAKNGGFKWRDNDWEDYKSTVLRRKGPDGKTLSNATKSTKLGGGSVVHGGSYGVESSVGYTDETGTSADFSEMREVEEGKGRHKFGIRGGDGEKRKKNKKRHEHDNDYKDPDLQEYRDERPARVGGLNRQADGTYTDYSATGTEPSELGSNVSARPLVKDSKSKPSSKDQKKDAKAKEQRAKERFRKAKLAEKEAAKVAAAEAKAKKEAEKLAAKQEKAEQKKAKKAKSTIAPSEIGGPAMTEYTALESEYGPRTEYTGASTEYTASEVGGPAPNTNNKQVARRAPPSAAYSFVTGDDTQTVYTGVYTDELASRAAPSVVPESSYYSDYRPNAESARPRRSRSQSRGPRHRDSHRDSQSQANSTTRSRPSSQSPRKQHRPARRQSTAQQSTTSDMFTTANGEARGHMAYPCHIPGLSQAGSVGVSESVSQVGGPREQPGRRERGGRDVMAGYRRGGVRTVRRDSLSDSDS